MEQVVVQAPGKLNLALDVVGRAENGYHLVDMVMQTVDVYETVQLKKRPNGIGLSCSDAALPCDAQNLAHRAATVFFSAAEVAGGVDIHLEKQVPVGAGMGGGSADAAGVLVGLNALYETGFTTAQLAAMAAPLGADVPFAVVGGTARLTGVGDIISPLPSLPGCWFTICMPPYSAATAQVYSRYDQVGAAHRPACDALAAAVEQGNLSAICAAMGNALQKASGGADTEEICALLRASGALAAQLTGSGAAVFGVYASRAAALGGMDKLWPRFPRSFVAQPAPHGARVTQAL